MNSFHVCLTPIMVVIVFFFLGCKEEKVIPPSEGELHYEITYPNHYSSLMSLLPSEMVMTFKDGKFVNTIEHKSGIFSSRVISDCKKKDLTMVLEFGLKKYYAVMDQETADSLTLAQFPVPEIFDINRTDTAAGFNGLTKMAVFSELSDGRDMEIIYTEEIDLPDVNWCNQFSKIDGVLLKYELEQFGMRMRLEATKFVGKDFDLTPFDVNPKFEEVSIDKLMYEFQEIFNSLIDL